MPVCLAIQDVLVNRGSLVCLRSLSILVSLAILVSEVHIVILANLSHLVFLF